MATGNADYMTAEERINWKKSHHMGDQQSLAGDEFFAGLSADKAQEMLDLVTSIDDNAKVLEKEKNWVKTEAFHFCDYTDEELQEEFTIEESETRWFINDPSDDYYEEINIVEKEIL